MTFACVFPGQGSQSIGMLSELADHHPAVLDNFKTVSDALGYDVWALIQNGPEEKLNQTAHTQVAMFTADVAVFKLLQQKGLATPAWMAGHSLGEYAALAAASAIGLADGAKLVAKRGELMQQTVPAGLGAMAAIVGLSDEAVNALCQEISTTESWAMPANYNTIGQVVIAGHTDAIKKAISLAEQEGAKLAKIIPVSVPCHCPLLTEAAAAFEDYLAGAAFKQPNTSVISNVDLSVYTSVDQIRRLLKEQLTKPVRWVETIQLLQGKGVQKFLECGPGKVLSGLIKRIDKSLQAHTVYDSTTLEQAIAALQGVRHE